MDLKQGDGVGVDSKQGDGIGTILRNPTCRSPLIQHGHLQCKIQLRLHSCL